MSASLPALEQRRASNPLLNDIFGSTPLPRNGHLGVLKAIREELGFWQSTFHFSITDEQPTGIRSSGSVFLDLEYAAVAMQCCSFSAEVETPRTMSRF
jgi:hypothetical protein